ncbi:MAG: 3-dehydroquinate synthase [Prevotellaceae bacterium]|jgi:3-dehydroquinate synthase|nr:3-dehydroquinate synthase [Prevotellaceae bacterium]
MIIKENLGESLRKAMADCRCDALFILTDSYTHQACLPVVLEQLPDAARAHSIVIPAGEGHKNLETTAVLWRSFVEHAATRHSLLVNLGGGMVMDLGGFAAATFKRGMPFINLPTTLLGAVDAAIGGKTGINLFGLKNEIGVFAEPLTTIIYLPFLYSLDPENRYSGFAEMVKHALIDSPELLSRTFANGAEVASAAFAQLLSDNLAVKRRFVRSDPREKNLRKALNLGHTFGHAFEMLSHKINHPLLHGTAVMWGLVCETLLSHSRLGLDKAVVLQLLAFAKAHYPPLPFSCQHYDDIHRIMIHDKKNCAAQIHCTLLRAIGQVEINQTVSREEICECLDFIS